MSRSTCFAAVLAAVASTAATTCVQAADAAPDPVAAIKAMTNTVERGNAWVAHIDALAKTAFPQAEALADEVKGALTGRQLADLNAKLAIRAVQKTDDASKVKAYVNAIRSVQEPTAQTAAQKKQLDDYKAARIVSVISTLTYEHPDGSVTDPVLAASIFAEHKALMNEDQISSLEVSFLKEAVHERDRAGFDKRLAAFLAQPMSERKVNGLTRIARAIQGLDDTLAEKLLREALADKAVTGQQRVRLLTSLANMGGYRDWKTVQLETLAFADKGEIPLRLDMLQFAKAFEYNDFVFAADLLKRALILAPKDYNVLLGVAQGALIRNDLMAAAGALRTALENERLPKGDRDFTEALLFFAEGKPVGGFDQAFAAKQYAAADKLRLFYKVSEFLFRCQRYELCRAIHGEIMTNMFSLAPLEKKTFTVEYDRQAPRTAEAWARTPAYKNWDGMETRFVPYGDMFDYSVSTDIGRYLIDAVPPESPEGYRTGVFFLCDDEGLHIYVRADDPNPDDIVALKRTGGNIEMKFKAGAGQAPYNVFFHSLPNATGGYVVDWSAPTKTYALARDIFKRDAVSTPEGIAAHVFVPWHYFCAQLPFDGNDWQFGMIRGIPGVAQLTLTGDYHEFGRLVHLVFKVTPQECIDLKRKMANRIFMVYSRLRNNPNEFIQAWNDSALGDPAFFTTVLEPMLKDLDEAGARLTGEKALSAGEVEEVFAKYVPAWENIKYAVAEKRAAYLKEKFMK